MQTPKQGERRERKLQELVKKSKCPVALFVYEMHNLNDNTLTGLKRLIEVVKDGGGRLYVVLAGHPKLCNDLRRPTMAEMGYRTDIFTLDRITGGQRDYIQWLLKTSSGKSKPEDILATESVDLLVMKLRTPLQVQLHLTLAMEAGYQTGEKPINATLVKSVLSRQLDDLEPTLARHDYRLKDMVEQFDAKPAEIRALFSNQLDRSAQLNCGTECWRWGCRYNEAYSAVIHERTILPEMRVNENFYC